MSGLIELSSSMFGPVGNRIGAFISGALLYLWDYSVDYNKKWPYGKGAKYLKDLKKL